MTILQILEKLAGGSLNVIAFLERAAEAAPDLAPKAQELIALLQSAASQANLVAVASALPGEIANIAQGKLEPKDHPSDAV